MRELPVHEYLSALIFGLQDCYKFIQLCMADQDNTQRLNTRKQILFWNLRAIDNLHSLSSMMLRSPYPQLRTQKDEDWKKLCIHNRLHINGEQAGQTFISRSTQYVTKKSSTFDKIALLKQQNYDLNVIKHQFWTRIYKMKPITKEASQCRKIVRDIVWRQRLIPYMTAMVASSVVNVVSGIAKLKPNQRILTFVFLFAAAQIVVRVKKSDKIFYSLPELPSSQLEKERKMILQQSMVVDGRINSYDICDPMDQKLLKIAQNSDQKQKKQILQAMGYNYITKQNLI